MNRQMLSLIPCRAKIGWVCLLALLCCKVQVATAQTDSLLVTKNFKFKDGLYLSLESFQRNKPDLDWGEVRAQVFSNPQTFLTQVASIEVKDTNIHRPLSITALWGISLDGIPYIQLPPASTDSDLPTFAGLRVRGKLCYFEYEKTERKDVLIQAYNPLNGRPFRQGYVERDVLVAYAKILNFGTGEIVSFAQDKLLEQIEDDSKLHNTVAQLSEEEVAEKLFKCLLIYDDRHPVFIR
ncbi:MAG: hypothetical protein AAGK47_08950 [Bacteroidota bacterium]